MLLKRTFYFFGILFLFLSCKENKTKVSTVNQTEENVNCENGISNIIGIVQVDDENYHSGDIIKVFDDKERVIDSLIVNEEYQVLTFYCISQDERYFKVKWSSNKIALLNKSENKLKLISWSDYLIHSLVNFDPATNPIRTSKDNSFKKLEYDSDEFYRIIEIDGDWAKIDWGTVNESHSGWIRWKEDNCLVIEISPFA